MNKFIKIISISLISFLGCKKPEILSPNKIYFYPCKETESISLTPNKNYLYQDSTLSLTVSHSCYNCIYEYNWYGPNGNLISSNFEKTIKIDNIKSTQSGDYYVTLSKENCTFKSPVVNIKIFNPTFSCILNQNLLKDENTQKTEYFYYYEDNSIYASDLKFITYKDETIEFDFFNKNISNSYNYFVFSGLNSDITDKYAIIKYTKKDNIYRPKISILYYKPRDYNIYLSKNNVKFCNLTFTAKTLKDPLKYCVDSTPL